MHAAGRGGVQADVTRAAEAMSTMVSHWKHIGSSRYLSIRCAAGVARQATSHLPPIDQPGTVLDVSS